jgi:hypothetical protein
MPILLWLLGVPDAVRFPEITGHAGRAIGGNQGADDCRRDQDAVRGRPEAGLQRQGRCGPAEIAPMK